MRIVAGDLIVLAEQGAFDVIVHGCNCFCAMGAGIAAGIRTTFPEAWAADQQTRSGDRAKLGTLTAATVTRDDRRLVVVNAYTQYDFGGHGVLADYDAIRTAFREIKARYSGLRIGYPKLGAGLAGGDWDVISAIVEEELLGEDHTLVEYVPAGTASLTSRARTSS